jgi:hypothetical protein
LQEILRIFSDHPLVAMAACFVILMILYFLFKSLIKLALVILIVAVAIGGYFYFQHPGDRPANLKEAVEKARTGTDRAVEKGKEAYGKGRELLGKGKEAFEKGTQAVDRGKDALEKGIDKGKAVVEKGKEVTGEVGKFLGGEKEAGTK